MLENLDKPVIITGSQIPIAGFARNDGGQNLVTSLLIANPAFSGLPVVPEVCIYFRDQLLRGNRSQKRSASGYAAFVTPRYEPLGEAGEHIVIYENRIRKPTGRAFTVHKQLDTNVVPVLVFPGIQKTQGFKDIFSKDSEAKAYILLTYGTGNAPDDDEFLDVIAQATAAGKIVVNVTQCDIGKVELGLYETSAGLLDRNVVSGTDLTLEAALCKLMVLLGNEDLKVSEVGARVEQNLAGEQGVSIFHTQFQEKGSISSVGAKYRFRGADTPSSWEPQLLSKALLRLRNSSITTSAGGEDDSANIQVYVNLSGDAELDPSKPNYAGNFVKKANDGTNMHVFDVTSTVRSLVAPGSKVSFTVATDSAGVTLKWKHAELVFYVDE